MTRSHGRTHAADYGRIKRFRERTRDGTQLTMPEVNFMSQSNGYTAPQGRPRSTPPLTLRDLISGGIPPKSPGFPAERPAVEPAKHSGKGQFDRSPEHIEKISRGVRNATLQSRAKATRLAARLNDIEPVPDATWMTITQFAKATGRARQASLNYTARHKHWQKRIVKAPGVGVGVFAIPHAELPEQFRPVLPVIEPVALQPSLWSRFCQWAGW